MNDFTQNIKYKAPDILRNNLDRFAQKLEVKRVPEAKLQITLKPLKKIIKPITTFICITNFCFDGTAKATKPRTKIGRPSIAGI